MAHIDAQLDQMKELGRADPLRDIGLDLVKRKIEGEKDGARTLSLNMAMRRKSWMRCHQRSCVLG